MSFALFVTLQTARIRDSRITNHASGKRKLPLDWNQEGDSREAPAAVDSVSLGRV